MKSHAIITLEDTGLDIWLKMSGDNPGAMAVLTKLSEYSDEIDPKCWNKVQHLLALDDMGIRGEKLWKLYKDVCGENIGRLLLLLRANQLGGHVTRSRLEAAALGYGFDPEEWDNFLAKVQARLPSFGVNWEFGCVVQSDNTK